MGEPKWLGQKDWQRSFELVPRVAVNLVPVRRKFLGKKMILLTKRGKPPLVGSWHMAGSFIRKGETMMECAGRVAKEELGVGVKQIWWGGIFDNLTGDQRGQVIDIVYYARIGGEAKAVGDTNEIGWFSKLPEKIGFGQKETLKKLGWR